METQNNSNKKRISSNENDNIGYEVFKFWKGLDYKEGVNTWKKLGDNK